MDAIEDSVAVRCIEVVEKPARIRLGIKRGLKVWIRRRTVLGGVRRVPTPVGFRTDHLRQAFGLHSAIG